MTRVGRSPQRALAAQVEMLRWYPDLIARRDAVRRVVERAGTPLYLGVSDIVLDRHRALVRALASHWDDAVVAYSFKTNYQVARARVLQRAGAWAEVVSGGEYRLARTLGHPPERIVFNGPGKTDRDVLRALRAGSVVNVNDGDELRRVVALTKSARRRLPIGLRVNASVRGLPPSRFGFALSGPDAQRAVEAVRRSSGLRLAGLHLHLFGDADEPAWYRTASVALFAFAARCLDAGIGLEYVDVGGGFPAHSPKPHSRSSWNPRPIEEYVETIARASASHLGRRPCPRIIVEPGRYLVTDAIVFLTRVVAVGRRGPLQMVTTDGSVSMMPLTHYRPHVIRAFTSAFEPAKRRRLPTEIHGATCRENDVLYRGRCQQAQVGDFVAFYAAGAYNAALCPPFIFDTPPLRLV